MKLTILGSGTVDPLPHRRCSGYYVETSTGPLLMDLGNGALRQAVECGLEPQKVRRVLLSHLHPDHTADLVPYLFARKYAPESWRDSPDLTLYGPRGTADFLECLYSAWPSLRPGETDPKVYALEFGERDSLILADGQMQVSAFPVEHASMAASAFRIVDGESTLAYSGDSRLCQGLKRASQGVDLFLCECSCFPRGCEPLQCRDVHLSWEDVSEICEHSKPKQVVLTHLYEAVLAAGSDPVRNLTQTLSIPVSLAEDGAVYDL